MTSSHSLGENGRSVDAVFLNGTVGAGKSTVADVLSDIERSVHAVIEKTGETALYADALEARGLFVCRLTARREVVAERLEHRHRHRHRGDAQGLVWHHARAVELDRILHANAAENLLLDSTTASPHELAASVRHAAGWDG